jgi:hypothetical protein
MTLNYSEITELCYYNCAISVGVREDLEDFEILVSE